MLNFQRDSTFGRFKLFAYLVFHYCIHVFYNFSREWFLICGNNVMELFNADSIFLFIVECLDGILEYYIVNESVVNGTVFRNNIDKKFVVFNLLG